MAVYTPPSDYSFELDWDDMGLNAFRTFNRGGVSSSVELHQTAVNSGAGITYKSNLTDYGDVAVINNITNNSTGGETVENTTITSPVITYPELTAQDLLFEDFDFRYYIGKSFETTTLFWRNTITSNSTNPLFEAYTSFTKSTIDFSMQESSYKGRIGVLENSTYPFEKGIYNDKRYYNNFYKQFYVRLLAESIYNTGIEWDEELGINTAKSTYNNPSYKAVFGEIDGQFGPADIDSFVSTTFGFVGSDTYKHTSLSTNGDIVTTQKTYFNNFYSSSFIVGPGAINGTVLLSYLDTYNRLIFIGNTKNGFSTTEVQDLMQKLSNVEVSYYNSDYNGAVSNTSPSLTVIQQGAYTFKPSDTLKRQFLYKHSSVAPIYYRKIPRAGMLGFNADLEKDCRIYRTYKGRIIKNTGGTFDTYLPAHNIVCDVSQIPFNRNGANTYATSGIKIGTFLSTYLGEVTGTRTLTSQEAAYFNTDFYYKDYTTSSYTETFLNTLSRTVSSTTAFYLDTIFLLNDTNNTGNEMSANLIIERFDGNFPKKRILLGISLEEPWSGNKRFKTITQSNNFEPANDTIWLGGFEPAKIFFDEDYKGTVELFYGNWYISKYNGSMEFNGEETTKILSLATDKARQTFIFNENEVAFISNRDIYRAGIINPFLDLIGGSSSGFFQDDSEDDTRYKISGPMFWDMGYYDLPGLRIWGRNQDRETRNFPYFSG